MSFVGVCQICENAEGRYACDQCGSLVCTDHYDDSLGVCTDCAATLRHGDGDPDRPD